MQWTPSSVTGMCIAGLAGGQNVGGMGGCERFYVLNGQEGSCERYATQENAMRGEGMSTKATLWTSGMCNEFLGDTLLILDCARSCTSRLKNEQSPEQHSAYSSRLTNPYSTKSEVVCATVHRVVLHHTAPTSHRYICRRGIVVVGLSARFTRGGDLRCYSGISV